MTPDGDVTSRYDKVRRVPFGEYVPLRGLLEALGAPLDRVRTDAVAGTGPAVVDLPDGTRLAVAISWEVFFGGRVREGVKAGGEAVLNPTNGASYTGTILQTQQVASSRLRAIETGRWLVQVSPTGFSEFVTPDGDVLQRTGISEQKVIRERIMLRTATRGTWGSATGRGSPRWWWCSAGRGCSPCSTGHVDDHGDRSVVDEGDADLGAESPGGHRRAEPPQLVDDGLDERFGLFRAGCGDPARPATARGVAVQRELADDQELCADVGHRAVHHAVLVVEDP